MNIFVLDEDPLTSAYYQCDKHIVKMVLESAQMLCTAHRLWGNCDPRLYQVAYQNHPCTKWTRLSKDNYEWHSLHWLGLCEQYQHRYNRVHGCYERLSDVIVNAPRFIPNVGFTDHPICMPDEYKTNSIVDSYRSFYHSKPFKMVWSKVQKPSWFKREE